MDHFKILKRAWDIVWKYRALWLIGLVLVLVGGGVGAGFRGGPPNGGSGGGDGSGGSGSGLEWHEPAPDWSTVREKVVPIVIAVGVVLLFLFVLLILLGILKLILRWVTRTSLIKMVNTYEETGEQVGFWAGLRLGWSRSAFNLFLANLLLSLLPVLLGILMALVFIALAIVIIVLAVSAANAGGGGAVVAAVVFGIAAFFLAMLMLLPLILIGVLVRVVISLTSEIAFRVCVIERRGAWEAIKEAVGLIRRNLWPVVLQYLLLLGLGIAWGIVLFIVNLPLVFLAFLVAGLPGLIVGGAAGMLLGPIAGVVLGLLLFVPIMIVVIGLPNVVLSTFATVYHSTVWTLTYRELRVLDTGGETEVVEVKAAGPEQVG